MSDSNATAKDSDAEDLLVRIDRGDPDPATNETDIGKTGTFNIEAIALQPKTATLFAADAGTLGTLDTATGRFTSIGTEIGTGSGASGRVAFDDVDGLTFDPTTGLLYGSQREAQDDDILLRIDPATGAAVAGGLDGADYVVVEALPGLSDIDDLAIDPADGQMYAIANADGRGDHLVRIDTSTGAVSDVGALSVDDMEGLSFAPDGHLIGTTGKVHGDEAIADIDKATGKASNLRPLDNSEDYEALACLVSPAAPAASLTIVEDAVPDDAQDFAFTTTGGLTPGDFNLDDDPASPLAKTTTYADLAPGTYTVQQTPVAAWPLVGLSCTDASGGTTTDQASANASVNIAPGDAVTCVFVNSPAANPALTPAAPGLTASLTIVEDAVPDDAQDFAFTTTGGLTPGDFNLDDDPASPLARTTTYADLAPGTYTVNQTPVAAWPLVGLSCTDASGGTTTDQASANASVNLAPGDAVTCVFVNSPAPNSVLRGSEVLGISEAAELPRTGQGTTGHLPALAGMALAVGGLAIFFGAGRARPARAR